jgi:uncharacterized glyoxalase superfamily protein PhnB
MPTEGGHVSQGDRPNIFPTLRYADASAALDWLKRAFGFEEKAVYRGEDGTIHHAELRLGAGLIMLGQSRPDDWTGGATLDPHGSPQGIYVVVDDPDAHHDRAVAAGAQIMRPLVDQDYGSREYSVRDLEGNRWSFGTYDPYATA